MICSVNQMFKFWFVVLLAFGICGGLCLLGTTCDQMSNADKHRYSSTERLLQAVDVAMRHYRSEFSALPRDLDTLVTYERIDKRYGAHVRSQGTLKVLVDSWGRPITYRLTGANQMTYLLYSSGANGVDEDGQGDDILTTSSQR